MTSRGSPAVRAVGRILVVAVAYYVTGRLGLLLAIPPGFATAVWPPSGIALGATLIWGYRVWPGVVLGSFALNVAVSLDLTDVARSAALALAIGGGAALQACAGTFLIRRFVGFPSELDTLRDAVTFLALGGPVASVVNATIGPTALLASGTISPERFAFSSWTWWSGDVLGVLTITPLVLVLAAEPRASWARRRVPVGIPLALMLVLSALVFVWVSALERERVGIDFDRRATTLIEDVEASVDVHAEVVRSLATFFDASDEVTRTDFARFVGPALESHPGIQALSWNPLVEHSERRRVEADARAIGLDGYAIVERDPDGELVPRGDAPIYVPLLYLEPLDENRAALGFDIYSERTRADAVDRARRTGRPAATAPIVLVQDAEDVTSYLLVTPVERPVGFAVGVFRAAEVIGAAIGDVTAPGLRVTVEDTAGGRPLFQTTSPAARDAYEHRGTIDVADRTWTVTVQATPAFVDTHRSIQAWMVLAGGTLFSGLLGLSLLVMTGRAARVEELVDRRTAELSDVNQRLEVARADLESRVDDLARSNAELERFAYIASHDLQEPLRTIASHTQLLQRRYAGQLGEDADESIGFAVDGAKRMQALIDDLLTYSRVGRETELTPVDTAAIVSSVLDDLRGPIEERGARLHIGPLPVVDGNASALNRLFLNLVDNAIKFAGDDPPEVWIEATDDGPSWVFTVRDAGIGFDQVYTERIFGMFERLHSTDAYPGTGIGLAIVRRVIDLHGGTVTVESAPGQGTTFRFTLPRADDPVASGP